MTNSTSTDASARRRAFRQLHESGCFVIPNPWDAGSAAYLQGLGFQALATTSSGVAWRHAKADGQMTLEEVLVHLRENEPELKDLAKRANRHRRHEAGQLDAAAEGRPVSQVDEDAVLGDEAFAGGTGQPGAGGAAAAAAAAGRVVAPGRQVHPYAQRGPRNQPKRRSRRG